MKSLDDNIIELNSNEYFVFGSNTQGRHGKGSALIARQKFGAIYGQAYGLQGNSYAICTKDISSYPYKQISKQDIINQINDLYAFASEQSHCLFYIVYKGYGNNLNGYTCLEMAQMFHRDEIPVNIVFHNSFKILLGSLKS